MATAPSPKHTPATPLPWFQISGTVLERRDNEGSSPVGETDKPQDTAYIAHAANAYPLAVEFARFVASQDPNRVTKQGERARALLRELGEE